MPGSSSEQRRRPYPNARAVHRFDESQAAARKARALPGGEPHVALVALFGEPDAAFLARDLERAGGFKADDLALRDLEADAFGAQLHRAYWQIATL